MRSPIVFLLIAALLIGSALAMLFTAGMNSGQIRSRDDDAAARAAVRAYYAAVDTYLASGDPLLVRQTLAPDLLLPDGTHQQSTDLERFLLAVRETYPALTLNVLSVVSAGMKVLAEIEIDRGSPSMPDIFSLPAAETTERVVEMFDVDDGKISRRWSSWTGLALSVPYPTPPIDVTLAPGQSLALARIDVAESEPTSFGVPGEALLIVDRGQLLIDRPGRVSVFRASSGVPEKAESAVPLRLGPGDAVLLHDWNTVVSTTDPVRTTLLAAVATPSRGDYADHGQPASSTLFDQALKAPHGMEIGEFVTVTTLAQSENVDGWQQAQLSSSLLMLSPGFSLTIHRREGEVLVAAVAPAARLDQRPVVEELVITNSGQDLISIWTLHLRPLA